jgi:hypothetical protein
MNGSALRVLRGGSWNNPPANLRCTNRNGNQPSNRNTNNGFRCASDLEVKGLMRMRSRGRAARAEEAPSA